MEKNNYVFNNMDNMGSRDKSLIKLQHLSCHLI